MKSDKVSENITNGNGIDGVLGTALSDDLKSR